MLPINPETICFLINKARQFQAKEGVVIPDEPLSPAEDWALQILADQKDDPVYQEFKAVINDLEPDQLSAVVALMWIGRGDFDKSEWEEANQVAVQERTIPTADYLITTPCVAEYLEEGLSQFGYHYEE
ncbi:MAG: hypothetical protein K0S08_1875 [Gammaproteobacteria bacterium]|jgi:hypothetical protein|nr:hypothetical protein [Gammaproteobacteria bacterium]